YVDHHDKAYAWAVRRKLEVHPKTGAAQLVEIRETVREIAVPAYVQKGPDGSRRTDEQLLFASVPDDELLGYGVPPEWLADVRKATEASLLTLADHLPGEAAEALLELATGGKPRRAAVILHGVRTLDHATPMLGERLPARDVSDLATSVSRAFTHPDARRRFRMIETPEELRRALDDPWDKWTIFLHPEQREWAERDYSGAARISGSAGTGKTIVAVHRA
ncbi:UvrD/REP type DNA helicase, partial [mine drainage metagenome]